MARLNWGAALQTLGQGLGGIAQQKYAEQQAAMQREQQLADEARQNTEWRDRQAYLDGLKFRLGPDQQPMPGGLSGIPGAQGVPAPRVDMNPEWMQPYYGMTPSDAYSVSRLRPEPDDDADSVYSYYVVGDNGEMVPGDTSYAKPTYGTHDPVGLAGDGKMIWRRKPYAGDSAGGGGYGSLSDAEKDAKAMADMALGKSQSGLKFDKPSGAYYPMDTRAGGEQVSMADAQYLPDSFGPSFIAAATDSLMTGRSDMADPSLRGQVFNDVLNQSEALLPAPLADIMDKWNYDPGSRKMTGPRSRVDISGKKDIYDFISDKLKPAIDSIDVGNSQIKGKMIAKIIKELQSEGMGQAELTAVSKAIGASLSPTVEDNQGEPVFPGSAARKF